MTEPAVLDKLESLQRELESTGADIKSVERRNVHFTVRFLGEVTESQAKEADSRLRSLELHRASVELKGVGAFPGARDPRVVWVGVSSVDEDKVASIATPVIRALGGLGERDDRPFRAHATIARLRSRGVSAALASLISSNSGLPFGQVLLSKLKLKSSQLTPQGPIYTDLGEYALS